MCACVYTHAPGMHLHWWDNSTALATGTFPHCDNSFCSATWKKQGPLLWQWESFILINICVSLKTHWKDGPFWRYKTELLPLPSAPVSTTALLPFKLATDLTKGCTEGKHWNSLLSWLNSSRTDHQLAQDCSKVENNFMFTGCLLLSTHNFKHMLSNKADNSFFFFSQWCLYALF